LAICGWALPKGLNPRMQSDLVKCGIKNRPKISTILLQTSKNLGTPHFGFFNFFKKTACPFLPI
jgi:hypothetical protein